MIYSTALMKPLLKVALVYFLFIELIRPPVIVSDASWADYQRRTLLAEYILYRQAAMNWNEEEHRFEHIPGLYPHPLDPTSVRKHRDRSKQESRWECDRCGKRYKYSRGLAMHRRLECGKEPMFHCPYCPQKCHQKGNMVIHIKKKHPNNNNQSPTWFSPSPFGYFFTSLLFFFFFLPLLHYCVLSLLERKRSVLRVQIVILIYFTCLTLNCAISF